MLLNVVYRFNFTTTLLANTPIIFQKLEICFVNKFGTRDAEHVLNCQKKSAGKRARRMSYTSMQPRPILRQDRTSRIASPTRNSHALYWPKMFPIFRQERTLKSLGRDPIPVLPCPFQHYRQSGQANDTSFLSRPPTIPCFL